MATCDDGVFIPLVVYFFLTLAAGFAGGAWFVYQRVRGGAGSPTPASSGDTLDADPASGSSFLRSAENWAIDFRALRFGPRIGVGNAGEVFRGSYKGRPVAIKKLLGSWVHDDGMVARFREEILLMSTMNHPHVLLFVGAVLDREAGNICLVTELCERGTLHDLLRSREPLTWRQRLKIARDTALGMDYVHTRAGVIQRDLKSTNLLVTAGYDVKIADFGLSRANAPGRMHTYCGTPANMAPEVVRQEPYDEKADVFSFGVVLWELLTREEPYEGYSGLGLAYAVANEGLRPPVPAFCPAEWARLMAAALSDAPEDRPSFDAIQRELFAMQRSYDEALAAAEDATLTAAGGRGRQASRRRASLALPGEFGDTDGAGEPAGPRALPGPWVNQNNFVFMGGPPVAASGAALATSTTPALVPVGPTAMQELPAGAAATLAGAAGVSDVPSIATEERANPQLACQTLIRT